MSDKVVARFNDGRVIKGYLKDFSLDKDFIIIEGIEKKIEKKKEHKIPVEELKALFFVKSFEGDSSYREKKAYGLRKSAGRKVFIRFNDGESLVGFVEGELPWKKGFFLSKSEAENKGFFLVPVDEETNNIKIFVVGSSIKDITSIP